MKEQRKRAKDGPDADPMKKMRERYELAVEMDRENRDLAIEDLKFVTVPGHQWDEAQRKARKGRPCYEFPILRSHWRQVVNDQKKARPGIKVRAVEDGDMEGAELRQGLLRNIEALSNAEQAYDSAFEIMVAAGMGVWRVVTRYSHDDGWDQDLAIEAVADPLNSVWFGPHKDPNARDAKYAFVEESIPREEFTERWPKAEAVDFETARQRGWHQWFSEDSVRICEYFRLVPVEKTLLLLSDGRTVDKAELTPEAVQEMVQQQVTVTRERICNTHKVISSIVSGSEELEGPFDSVFNRIPLIPIYANRHFIDGKWTWCGMVRFSRDPQKLLNYNLTTAQEVVSKQPKSPYLVTPKMLEGDGIKALWNAANAVDVPYLPYTPDPAAPQGRPVREPPPDMPAAFTMLTQVAVDMLKASDGIHDASVGARSNETSGKAILARQQEGDTATFDYQDALGFGIKATGELLLSALPKVYDTPRTIRVLGKDGSEDWAEINQEGPGGQKINDLSAGKYDTKVTAGASYDTQRMEFVDALTQLAQGNEAIAMGCPDLIVGSMDFPKAEEAAERLKLMLPPQIQQSLQKDAKLPPEVMQAQAQVEQGMQAVQEGMAQLQQAQGEADSERAAIEAAKKELAAAQKVMAAEFRAIQAELRAQIAESRPEPEQQAPQEASEVPAEPGMDEGREMRDMAFLEALASIQQQAAETFVGVQQALAQVQAPRGPRMMRVQRDEAGNIAAVEEQ